MADDPQTPLLGDEEDSGVSSGSARAESASQPDPDPRPRPTRKLYQDEIYGTKELSPLAVALIDTPEFQRLGTINQLGFTHTVFRGANHQRLDHSIGTYFVVRTLMRRIVQNHTRLFRDDSVDFAHPGMLICPRYFVPAPAVPTSHQTERRGPMGRWRGLTELVSAAGLLHDIGHVPVGHTLEDEFSVLEKHDSLGGPRLFEMLYGPRSVSSASPAAGAPRVENYFSPIRRDILPQPRPWERVPLPWVLEAGTYPAFFETFSTPNDGDVPVTALANWEVRDLIYLLLNFKETLRRSTLGQSVHTTFGEEIESALKSEGANPATMARVRFIKALWTHYSRPMALGARHEALPLYHPFMSDIVGNTICADLLDYLVRDGKRLKLDTRDNPRIQRYLVIRPASSFALPNDTGSQDKPDLRLTITAVSSTGLRRRDTVSDLLDLMRERYRFAEVVYYHAKKAAFSTMLAKAVELLRGQSPSNLRDGDGIYPAPWSLPAGTGQSAPHIAHFGDQALISYLADRAGEVSAPAGELLRGIRYRNEHRLLFTLDYDAACADGGGGPATVINLLRDNEDKGRRDIEAALDGLARRSDLPKLAPNDTPVLVYCPQIRMQAKEVAAHVEISPGKVMPLIRYTEDAIYQEVSAIAEKYPRLWRCYLFVHPKLLLAPMSPAERSLVLSALVDAFCAPFRVPENRRQTGSRFDYLPLSRRLGEAAPRQPDFLSGAKGGLRKRLEDPMFWRHVLQKDHASVAVTNAELDRGYVAAAVLSAADEADNRQRAGWPEEIRRFAGQEWYKRSATPAVDSARLEAATRFEAVGTSLTATAARRFKPTTWDSFVQHVAQALSR
jgi:HD superfamily phosphohydrolase